MIKDKLYLTEFKLKDFITLNIMKFNTLKEEILFNKKLDKFYPDIYLPKDNLIIEFDGYSHFNSIKTQKLDIAKNEYCKLNSLRIIRIPYFIQLSKESIRHYFNIDIEYAQSYSHGFIDNKALRPDDFNLIGLNLFKNILGSVPSGIKLEILKSIENLDIRTKGFLNI